MVTVCLVGASGYAGTHFRALLAQMDKGNATLAGVAIRTPAKVPERIAELERRGIPVFPAPEAMFAALSGACDLACIPTAIHTHIPLAVAAMDAGMNVFVEKPLCATADEFAPLFAAGHRTGRWVAVGYQNNYGPEILQLKERLIAGAFGALHSVRAIACAPRNGQYYHRNSWAGRLRDGGDWVLDSPFNNAFAHQLNLMGFLAGDAFDRSADYATVQAELYRVRPDIENADLACIRAVTARGVPVFYLTGHAVAQGIAPRIIMETDKATITWEHVAAKVTIRRADGSEETLVGLNADAGELHARMFDMVIDRVRDAGAFVCTARMAASQIVAMNGAHLSSPIIPLPDACRTAHCEPDDPRQPRPEAERTWFSPEGIMPVLDRSLADMRLFSELDVPWAHAGRVADVSALAAAARGEGGGELLFHP